MGLLDEELIPFAAAIRSLPGRPHISSGYRFITRGSRGVILQTFLVGGRRFCSRRAIHAWIAAVTAAAQRESKPAPQEQCVTNTKIERDLDDAGL